MLVIVIDDVLVLEGVADSVCVDVKVGDEDDVAVIEGDCVSVDDLEEVGEGDTDCDGVPVGDSEAV